MFQPSSSFGKIPAQDLDWVWKLLQQALSPGLGSRPPNLVFWDTLASMDKREWLGFERVLTVHNR